MLVLVLDLARRPRNPVGIVNTGIVDVNGIDEAPDGTFGGVRITFADDAVMQRYVNAGMAAVAAPTN